MQATITNSSRATGSRSLGRKLIFALIASCLGLLLAAGVAELAFRVLEYQRSRSFKYEGQGGVWVSDGRWGWKPNPGYYHIVTNEFDMRGTVNELNMNDVPFVPGEDESRTRIFALGDSHTYAYGVSMEQAWPKVVERKLNADQGADSYRVYNGGVTGFNMHQYLLRLIDQGPMLHANYVVLGLSYATDLYDLLPPDHGGWIYGGDRARDYFDFDSAGNLKQLHWEPSSAGAGRSTAAAPRTRQLLENLATFRYLRRSPFALFVGSHVKVKGQSLWPNMEVIMEKEPTPQHEYQWRLFTALLDRINEEANNQGSKLIVVGIPYIAQVYDETWKSSFAGNEKFSRTAGVDRVRTLCESRAITYIDTLEPLRARQKQLGRWLHYREDAHPTPEGHEEIAETIVRAGVVQQH